MQSMTIEEARRVLGDLVDRARIAREPTLILRYKTPAAVLVSADWYNEVVERLHATDGEA